MSACESCSRILVVDDDPLLRFGACAMLRDAGYDTVEAADGDEAMDILERREDIGIVFSDIQMPGSLDGLELAQAVRRRWPPIDMVLTSGRLIPRPEELPARVRYLPKPFGPAELLAEIRQLAAH